MRGIVACIVLITLCTAQAQDSFKGQSFKGDFYRHVHLTADASQLMASSGIGNQESIILESMFAGRYAILQNGKPWVIQFNPKIILRMANEDSYPLRPPSYHLDARYHRYIGTDSFKGDRMAFYLGVEHHSNGQSGSFFLPGDTIINLENGNFAQNYIEGGVSLFRNSKEEGDEIAFRSLTLSFQVTPPFSASWSGSETLDRLGFYRPFVTYMLGGVKPGKRQGVLLAWRKRSHFTARAGYILGAMDGAPGDDLNTRAILDLQYHYVLPFFDDMTVMLRFYRGQDYYNIRYDKTLSVLNIGIASNLASMKGPMRYLGK